MDRSLIIHGLIAKLNSLPNQIDQHIVATTNVLVLLVDHNYIDNNISAD